MYGFECAKKLSHGRCTDRRCINPKVCPHLKADHGRQISLLRKLRNIEGIKKIFISSGIRYDLLLSDKRWGKEYLKEIVVHHVSGQLKIAPEHTEEKVLQKMGKTGTKPLARFVDLFNRFSKEAGKKQYLTYYFMAAHPGCGIEDMKGVKSFVSRTLKINPEQVQIFTPSPSTYSTLMYYTGIDPFTGMNMHVEKNIKSKEAQKHILVSKRTVARKKKRSHSIHRDKSSFTPS